MTGIRAIALDVDGVLTDGGVWWGPNGEEWKRFSFADIMGVSRARKAGYVIALISGEDSPLVDRFAQKLGITYVEKNCKDKETALRRFSESVSVPLNEICFMGDDVNDAGAMGIAGLIAVPANAQPAVREKASFVSTHNGGNGAVRELIEALLASKASGS
jgi:3-deoxy-D-manno-octulosonate 8-phosphate phosphatase (KDO 8-P phosphatase)